MRPGGIDHCLTGGSQASMPLSLPLQLASLPSGQISFRSRGKGEAVVFLHGLLGSSKSWTFQFAHLAPDYRTIAWDAPGYGQSDLVAASIDAYAQALHEFIAHIDERAISLVGHSMGGTVAAYFAARFPELVTRLVLSCSHAGYGDPESAPMPAKFEHRMDELRRIGPAAYGANRARGLLPASTAACVVDYAAEIAAEVNPESLRRATRMLQRADNRPLLPGLRMPVLILTSEKDTDVRPDLKADLLRLTPATRHVDVPGVGHAPYFEAPSYYSDLISSFLSEGS